ncbi:MAG: hypothetical protein HDR00_14270 [Lachnospiraceae bacterium]|nr:hypothetical protein [Lachnospiraceae bacterium]
MMKEDIKWNDSNYKILDIIDMIEDNKEPQIPIKCPICNVSNAHIYMERWEDDKNRGTIWTWCSNCRGEINLVEGKGFDDFMRDEGCEADWSELIVQNYCE